MGRRLVMGNWKTNGRHAMAESLMRTLAQKAPAFAPVEVVVCPPYPYLALAVALLQPVSGMAVGAQDVSSRGDGAYTGEVSAEMVRDVGCQFAIIGHSERRTLFGDDDGVVAKKFARALAAELTPVLCVGETASERDGGRTEEVISSQLAAVFGECGDRAFARAVVAYEPVWAIGSGRAANPDEAQKVHRFIRETIGRRSPEAARTLRILYGGSVKAQNARDLFAQEDIDGGLIGGASLAAPDFVGICEAACLA